PFIFGYIRAIQFCVAATHVSAPLPHTITIKLYEEMVGQATAISRLLAGRCSYTCKIAGLAGHLDVGAIAYQRCTPFFRGIAIVTTMVGTPLPMPSGAEFGQESIPSASIGHVVGTRCRHTKARSCLSCYIYIVLLIAGYSV